MEKFMCDNCVDVNEISKMIQSIAPEVVHVLDQRIKILNAIQFKQPIGRRSVAKITGISERMVRTESNTLKELNLIDSTAEGMYITQKGISLKDSLECFFKDLKGIRQLEVQLKQELGIKKVIIADVSNDDELVLKAVGRLASEYLHSIIQENSIIGLTGGSTMGAVVEALKPIKKTIDTITVVPARGGLGNTVELQANTLAEKMSKKLNADYELLFTPDNLSKDSIDSLKNEPDIKKMFKLIENINILVFGIGRADELAKRRRLDAQKINTILDKGAVAEGFGYYFNESSEIVHEISTIGIDLDKFKTLDNLIAVAATHKKADAIKSICQLNSNLVLVTDISVAKSILNKEEI